MATMNVDGTEHQTTDTTSYFSGFNLRLTACIILNIAAFCCLIPGLTYPLLSVSVHIGELELMSQTRSTLGTIQYLHEEHADLPALLILIFSVFVPIVKFFLLIVVALWKSNYWRWHIFIFVRNWSKWSMADVFVTAIFVAFLSANAKPATMTAEVGRGFYFFLSYCLLSLAALQVMPTPDFTTEIEKQQIELAPSHPTSPKTADLESIEADRRDTETERLHVNTSQHQLRPEETKENNMRPEPFDTNRSTRSRVPTPDYSMLKGRRRSKERS